MTCSLVRAAENERKKWKGGRKKREVEKENQEGKK